MTIKAVGKDEVITDMSQSLRKGYSQASVPVPLDTAHEADTTHSVYIRWCSTSHRDAHMTIKAVSKDEVIADMSQSLLKGHSQESLRCPVILGDGVTNGAIL